MINIYKCNSLQDYHTLLSMYPNVRWFDGGECEHNPRSSIPAAFYVSTETTPPLMDVSEVETAQFNVDEFPSSYQFAELTPQLNVVDVLRVFLKHHNVYEEFKHLSLTSSVCRPRAFTRANKAIDQCGFRWMDAEEGEQRWSLLEHKWEQLCSDFNISEVQIGQYHNELFSKD